MGQLKGASLLNDAIPDSIADFAVTAVCKCLGLPYDGGNFIFAFSVTVC